MVAKKKMLPIADALTQILDPIINALNSNPNYNAGVSGDPGHEHPSMKDVGLRILLDSMIRPLHNQLHGDLKSQDNRKIPNVAERFTDSITQVNAHREKYQGREEDMMIDPRTFSIQHWFTINEARLDAYNELYDSLRSVYQYVTGEPWKFVSIESRRQTVDPTKIAADEKAKALALFSGERKLIKR